MDKLKQWIALSVLAAVAILAAGWVVLVSPKRGEAADLQLQAEAQAATNASLETQLQVLQAKAKELPKRQADLAKVSAKIPETPALPSLIRALTTASTAAGVEFVSMTPGTPSSAAPAAPVAAAPAGTVVDPAAAAAAGPAGNLSAIPLTINVFGDYYDIESFVSKLEGLPRALRVTNLVMTPGVSPTSPGGTATDNEDGRNLTTTITGTVFMATSRPAATAVVAPGTAPAPAPATAQPAN